MDEPEPVAPELPLEPVLPLEPEPITSMRWTWPLDERLARTWSPSLMSESEARCPFFITCVDSLTLSWSESWFFVWSNFSTFPVTCELAELDAPLEPIEPELALPEEPVPVEPDAPLEDDGSDAPELDEPVPIELESLDFDFDGSEALEPELPVEPDAEPLDPVEPEEPDEPAAPED